MLCFLSIDTVGPASSQQDLTFTELSPSRYNALSTEGKMEESGDIDARGKDLAFRCWQEDEDFLSKDKIAEWLGRT